MRSLKALERFSLIINCIFIFYALSLIHLSFASGPVSQIDASYIPIFSIVIALLLSMVTSISVLYRNTITKGDVIIIILGVLPVILPLIWAIILPFVMAIMR